MSWIVAGIGEAFLGIFRGIFSLLSVEFISSFGINIGAKFSSFVGDNVTFADTLKSVGTSQMNGMFETIFPGLDYFKYGLEVTGICLVVLITTAQIYESFFSDRAEHPIALLAKFGAASALVAMSYHIFVAAEFFFNKLYNHFVKAAFSSTVMGAGANLSTSEGRQTAVSSAIKSGSDMFDSDAVSKFINGTISGDAAKTTICTFICLFAVIAILVQFLMLLLEIVERYVTLGILFYTCPIAFATTASKKTSGVFSSWMNMVLSQFILMISNVIFLSVFLGAISGGMSRITTEKTNMNANITTYLIFLFMLVAWLMVAQKFDQHLKGLGLSTAQSGGSLVAAMMGAVGTGRMMMGGMKKGIRAAKGMHAAANGGGMAAAKLGTASAANFAGGLKGNEAKNAFASAGMPPKQLANLASASTNRKGNSAMATMSDGSKLRLDNKKLSPSSQALGNGLFATSTPGVNGGTQAASALASMQYGEESAAFKKAATAARIQNSTPAMIDSGNKLTAVAMENGSGIALKDIDGVTQSTFAYNGTSLEQFGSSVNMDQNQFADAIGIDIEKDDRLTPFENGFIDEIGGKSTMYFDATNMDVDSLPEGAKLENIIDDEGFSHAYVSAQDGYTVQNLASRYFEPGVVDDSEWDRIGGVQEHVSNIFKADDK